MLRIKKIIHNNILSKCLWLSLTFVFLFHIFTAASSFKQDIEQFFVDLKQDFDQIANATAVKGTNLSRTDRYFVYTLKKNQPFYSLIKTNSKGVLISEIIRGEKPEREFRDVGTQRWYTTVARTHNDYHGFLRDDEQGRYYLFWAKPVLKKTHSGSARFVGAVAAKVDLWDCFHKFSTGIEKPFLVRLGKKSLYSHKWKTEADYEEEALDIPGVKRISIRYGKSGMQQVPTDSLSIAMAQDSISQALKTTEAKVKDKKKPASLKKLNNFQKIIIVVIVVAVLVLLFYISKLIVHFKDWRLRKKIEKEDNLFR